VAGEKNLIADLVAIRKQPPKEILTRIFKKADEGVLTVPPDDRTAVLVRG
jgi:hypothetical protein